MPSTDDKPDYYFRNDPLSQLKQGKDSFINYRNSTQLVISNNTKRLEQLRQELRDYEQKIKEYELAISILEKANTNV